MPIDDQTDDGNYVIDSNQMQMNDINKASIYSYSILGISQSLQSIQYTNTPMYIKGSHNTSQS